MPMYACTIQVDDEKQTRLVEAKNQAKALAHVTKQHITVEAASSKQCVELGAAGVKIEEAGE